MEFLSQSWPWYVAGPLIAVIMVTMFFFGKTFGISSNLSTMCSAAGAGKRVEFFNFDWKSKVWNLVFLLGTVLGGVISATILNSPEPIGLNPETVEILSSYGIENQGVLPDEVFGMEALFSLKGLGLLILGGFMVGFGARYAGGCTSGHAISGLSNLQLPSLVAVIGFFIGGLIMVHVLFPLIF
ncbi:MAG: YeeE/YedE family protein [Flavobacteriales bacterium]